MADEESVTNAFAEIEQVSKGWGADGGLAAAVFNVGGGFVRKPFLELSRDEFEGGWKSNG